MYLHVPFCRSRCIYCDFYVVLEKYGGQTGFVEAVCQEIHGRFAQWGNSFQRLPLKSFYVGGGTPSLLSAQGYGQIMDTLRQYVAWTPEANEAEVTLEANPGAWADAPEAYRALGFNRISVGIQSLQDDELKALSRIHTAAEAEQTIQDLACAGFENISLDLMYGIPHQTLDSWQNTLARAVALPIHHLSMYGLKVEEGTPLDRLVELGARPVPGDDVAVTMYDAAIHTLESAGFRPYEFSNLARPGYESRHNQVYWHQGSYAAFGPSAHGYMDGVYYANPRSLETYRHTPLECEETPATWAMAVENALIFGLRCRGGVDVDRLEARFQFDLEQVYGPVMAPWLERGVLFWTTGLRGERRLCLSPDATPVSNEVLEIFLDPPVDSDRAQQAVATFFRARCTEPLGG